VGLGRVVGKAVTRLRLLLKFDTEALRHGGTEGVKE
jgi:hypothetical protein